MSVTITIKRKLLSPRVEYLNLGSEHKDQFTIQTRLVHIWRHPIQWWKLRPRKLVMKPNTNPTVLKIKDLEIKER